MFVASSARAAWGDPARWQDALHRRRCERIVVKVDARAGFPRAIASKVVDVAGVALSVDAQ